MQVWADSSRRSAVRTAAVLLCAMSLGGCAGSGGSTSDPAAPATSVVSRSPSSAAGTATGSATVSWIAPQANTDGSALLNLKGYRIYYGRGPDALDQVIVVDTVGLTRYVIEGLPPATWYFAMTSVNADGVESARSVPASKVVGG